MTSSFFLYALIFLLCFSQKVVTTPAYHIYTLRPSASTVSAKPIAAELGRVVVTTDIFTTKGNKHGENPFTIALNAYDGQNKSLFLKGHDQPDVVFLNLNPLVNASALEGLFFQRMFFDPILRGFSARYAQLQEELKLLKTGGLPHRLKVAELERFKTEIGITGFDTDLLVAGLISGKLTVIVDSQDKKQRVENMIKDFFTGRDSKFYVDKLIDKGYDPAIAARLAEEFARNRSFSFPTGFFNREGNLPHDGEGAIDALLPEIIDIRVLEKEGDDTIVTKGIDSAAAPVNTMRIRKTGDGYIIQETANKTYIISVESLKPNSEGVFYLLWSPRQVSTLRQTLSKSEKDADKLIVMPLGNADATCFSGKQDYTNLILAYNGRAILVDPSVRTLRNMASNELMEYVDAFYLSHVHWDHFGGMVDFVYRQLQAELVGAKINSMPLITSTTTYATAFDYLKALTGINREKFEKIFPRVDTEVFSDKEVAKFGPGVKGPELTAFNSMHMVLGRTFGHPLPTYGFRIKTKDGTVAYLADSLMPPVDSPLRSDFVEFFGTDVDLLISENGVPGVHITPETLVETFEDLAKIGSIYTDHAAGLQNQLGLQRAQVFEPLIIENRNQRDEVIADIDGKLQASGAVKYVGDEAGLSDFIRRHFAKVGKLVELEKGSVIYREGGAIEDSPYIFIIVKGSVNVEGVPGVKNNVVSLGKGHIIGEMAILRKAFTSCAEEDLKGLFMKDLIYQQQINGTTYFVWNIADEKQLESHGLDSTVKTRYAELFSKSQWLPRSKTVVASEKSTLVQIHIDEFIKLLNAELETADIGPLAVVLRQIMTQRYAQDDIVDGFLAMLYPTTAPKMNSFVKGHQYLKAIKSSA